MHTKYSVRYFYIIQTTTSENIRYLMHNYKFDMHQWYGSNTPLFNKIDLYNDIFVLDILLLRIDAQA